MIDGTYRNKLGDLVLERADAIIWLDLPMRVWLPRLLRRTARRIARREELWNGNRETLRDQLTPSTSVVYHALREYRGRRSVYEAELAHLPLLRLHSTRDVERLLHSAERKDTK